MREDPYCQYCPGAEIADVEHVFCTCERTRECWSWIRVKILGMCEQGLLFWIPHFQVQNRQEDFGRYFGGQLLGLFSALGEMVVD